MYLKSSVNLSGTSTKSQAARIVSTRLREELGGTSAAEWKAARQIGFKTTVLALNTEPGMVCSMTHADMPGGAGEFRVVSWRLNKDFSIDVQGRTTTDSMYDLVAGPKPADVEPTPVPEEILYDTGVPGIVLGTPKLSDYGTFVLDEMEVQPDDAGNMNIVSAHEIAMMLYYVDELAIDLWASLDAAIDKDTDPVTVACTVNPATARVFRVGDFVMFNDEAKSPDVGYRRSYECAQIVGPGSEGDVVPSGNFQFARSWADDTRPDFACFETLRTPHAKGIRFFKLDSKTFTYSASRRASSGRPDSRRGSRRSSRQPAWSRRSSAWPTTSGTARSRRSRWATTASLSCRVTGRATAARTRSRSPARSRSRTPWSSRCACRIARRSGASMRTSRCRPRTARARTG